MSKHLEFQIDDNYPSLEQPFKLDKDITLFHVALKLNIYNDPSGTFTLNIKRSNDTVIASKDLNISEINQAILAQEGSVEAYKLGYILFTFSNPVNLKRNKDYKLVLETAGYSFSGSSSIGWIKEYVNETNDLLSTPINDLYKAFSYRLWGFKNA